MDKCWSREIESHFHRINYKQRRWWIRKKWKKRFFHTRIATDSNSRNINALDLFTHTKWFFTIFLSLVLRRRRKNIDFTPNWRKLIDGHAIISINCRKQTKYPEMDFIFEKNETGHYAGDAFVAFRINHWYLTYGYTWYNIYCFVEIYNKTKWCDMFVYLWQSTQWTLLVYIDWNWLCM